MLTELDTIAAVATGFQTAGVGIIRLSGEQSLSVARRVFPALPASVRPRQLYYGFVYPAGGPTEPPSAPIDSGFAVHMPGPRSFTGEDVVELHVHGGPLNLRRVLQVALAAGARAAEPGEFTRRAFLNGKLDLAQAEAVLDIVHARTEAGLDVAQRQLGGQLSHAVQAIRQRLIEVRAHIELNIDFVHEDVPLFAADALRAELGPIREELQTLADTFERGRVLRDGITVALAGPPNAGKSSLFNALLRESRAIVTEYAGTTRDFLEERVDLGGVPFVLIDTAGLRDASDEIERIGVERSHQRIANADVVLAMVDGSLPAADQLESGWFDRIPAAMCVAVVNKSDLGEHSDWAESPRWAGAARVSALTSDGLATLAERVLDRAGGAPDGLDNRPIVTRARHHAALRRGIEATEAARRALVDGLPHEIAAGEVQLALDAIADIVGATTAEHVLDHIFREFCIGK